MEPVFYGSMAISQVGMWVAIFYLGKTIAAKAFIKDLDKLVELRMIAIIAKQIETRNKKESKND
jgi:hypothetical protein